MGNERITVLSEANPIARSFLDHGAGAMMPTAKGKNMPTKGSRG